MTAIELHRPEPVALTPMDMLNNAVERGASIETLERLIAVQERWEANTARKAFDAAIAAAKAEIPVIRRNREVDFTSPRGRTHYKYEDLAEVARTVNPVLAAHGLSYRFRTSSPPNEPVTVTCIISHRDGYSEENTLSAGRDDSGNKNSIQAIGSTLTYLQRMTLKAALGLAASEDDDGEQADAGQTISDEQAAEISDLIRDTKSNINLFLKWVGAPCIADIPAAKYETAVARLNAKKGKANAD